MPSQRRGLAAAALAAAALAWAGRFTDAGRSLEARTLDWRARRFSDARAADRSIVLLALDQASLDYFGAQGTPWPWPRSMYAAVLKFARKGGAKAVLFDILFTSESPYGVSEDRQLGRALKDFGGGVLAVELGRRASAATAGVPERFALSAGGEPASVAQPKKSAGLPPPELLSGARALADPSAEPDADGVFRRVPLLSELQGRLVPSLGLAAALRALGDPPFSVNRGALTLGGRRLPLVDGRLLVKLRGAALAPRERDRTFAAYPLGNVILSQAALEEGRAPMLKPEALKDKIVFVGYTAPGLLDNRPSSFSPVFSGTELWAAAADNLLHGDPLSPQPAGVTLLLVLLAAGLGAAASLIEGAGHGASLAALAGLAAAELAGAALAYRFAGAWVEIAAPQAALLLGFSAGAAYNFAAEGRERRYLKGAFSLYLSPEVVSQLVAQPDRLRLAGERRELSIFFSDIEGFTTLSETLPPDRLAKVMNRYLSAMTDIILESGGTLDKYIGDAIMAFWGAPLDCPDHALRACRSAVLNQRAMDGLRAQFEAEGLPPLRMRIGLNSGAASVGNLGSSKRFSYTALGDSVNLASRLESVNKQYGTYVMISQTTRDLAGDAVEVRELDFIKVKGKHEPIRVYELLGLRGETPSERLDHARRFEAALSLYRARRFTDAQKSFNELEDAASRLFADRCRVFAGTPPPPDWDGSYALKEK